MEIGEPGEGEIRVRNKAIGLNFIDVYYRKGVYKPAEMPFTPGLVLFFLCSVVAYECWLALWYIMQSF